MTAATRNEPYTAMHATEYCWRISYDYIAMSQTDISAMVCS
jgi:hypothetical protein